MLKRTITLSVLLFFIFYATQISLAGRFVQMGRFFRGLAMGNTGISSARDIDALFYNPAALANVQDNFIQAAVQMNQGAYLEKPGQDIANIFNTPLFLFGIPKYGASFLKNYPPRSTVGGILSVAVNYQVVDRGLNISGIFMQEIDAVYTIDRTNTNYKGEFRTRFDQTGIVGLSYPFFLGQIVLGLNLKFVTRAWFSSEYFLADANGGKPPNNSLAGGLFSIPKSFGFGADLGILYRMPGFLRFRAGFSVINVLGLNFANKSLNSPQELNIGVSIGPTIKRFRLIIALDYRDLIFSNGINDDRSRDYSIVKRIHFGAELGYYVEDKTFPLLNLRVGVNQGLFTAGAEVNLLFNRNMVIGYTYHTEDIGRNGAKIAVPNHIFYISTGFNLP